MAQLHPHHTLAQFGSKGRTEHMQMSRHKSKTRKMSLIVNNFLVSFKEQKPSEERKVVTGLLMWRLSGSSFTTCKTNRSTAIRDEIQRADSDESFVCLSHWPLTFDLCYRPAAQRHGRLCSAAHVSLLWTWVQASDIAERAHQISPWEDGGELYLPALHQRLRPASSAGTSHDLSQARHRTGEHLQQITSSPGTCFLQVVVSLWTTFTNLQQWHLVGCCWIHWSHDLTDDAIIHGSYVNWVGTTGVMWHEQKPSKFGSAAQFLAPQSYQGKSVEKIMKLLLNYRS